MQMYLSFFSVRAGLWAGLRHFPSTAAAFSVQNARNSPCLLPIASYFSRQFDMRSRRANMGSALKNKFGILHYCILPTTYKNLLVHSPYIAVRFLGSSSSSPAQKEPSKRAIDDQDGHPQPAIPPTPAKKPSLLQRFKQMYKEYWYVLLPVHCFTSVFWFGGFYYLAKSGFDVVPFLESMNVSESILKPLRDTGAGYLAVMYAMYKIASPVRYMVTLGGTTVAINYLKRWGYIKPMPSSDRVREMIKEKGDEFKIRRDSAMARFGRTSDSEKRKSDSDK